MKVNLKGARRNMWDRCMEFLIVDGRLVSDCEFRTMVNYGIAHGCDCADDIPEEVVKAILDCGDGTYGEYEDDETLLVSTRRVERVLERMTNLTEDEIKKIIDEL